MKKLKPSNINNLNYTVGKVGSQGLNPSPWTSQMVNGLHIKEMNIFWLIVWESHAMYFNHILLQLPALILQELPHFPIPCFLYFLSFKKM